MKPNRCTKCGKTIQQKNKSKLCSAHYHEKITMNKYWKKKNEN